MLNHNRNEGSRMCNWHTSSLRPRLRCTLGIEIASFVCRRGANDPHKYSKSHGMPEINRIQLQGMGKRRTRIPLCCTPLSHTHTPTLTQSWAINEWKIIERWCAWAQAQVSTERDRHAQIRGHACARVGAPRLEGDLV